MARAVGSDIKRRITTVRRALRFLDHALAAFALAIRTYKSEAASPGKARRRRAPLSPKARAALKLQGRYMGYMRQLKPGQKAMVRAVKAKSGTKAEITRAQELAGKRKAA